MTSRDDDIKELNAEGVYPQEAPAPSNPFVRWLYNLLNRWFPFGPAGGN